MLIKSEKVDERGQIIRGGMGRGKGDEGPAFARANRKLSVL
jgi:hypothetical protein